MGKTTRDEINIDLNGSIDCAIKELQRLKKLYPKGQVSLENEYEYGESYARLKLNFTRDKEPVEVEYDKWRGKLDKLGELRSSAAAYAREGDKFPRQAEIDKLEAELGAWSGHHRSCGMLTIYDGEVLMEDMMRGAYTREGVFRWKRLGFEEYDKMLAAISPDRNPTGGDAKQGSVEDESRISSK